MEGVLKPKRTKHEGEIGSENASPDFDFIKTKNSEKAKSIVDNCVSDIQLNKTETDSLSRGKPKDSAEKPNYDWNHHVHFWLATQIGTTKQLHFLT